MTQTLKSYARKGENVHVHTDPDDPSITWECSSAYCNRMIRKHPAMGGQEPRFDD